jgi:hypothetical protein
MRAVASWCSVVQTWFRRTQVRRALAVGPPSFGHEHYFNKINDIHRSKALHWVVNLT